jgi:hypothetical protein
MQEAAKRGAALLSASQALFIDGALNLVTQCAVMFG